MLIFDQDTMPKKGKAGSLFGRKTANAKIKAKKREDEDYAAEEREKQRELMALRRQHSDEREKQRLYEEERRKNKKFRDKEREKDKEAHRESRNSMLARKQAEEEKLDAQIKVWQARAYYRNFMFIRWRFDLPSLQENLGFDWPKYWAMKTEEEKRSYTEKWYLDLEKRDFVEYLRFICELRWGRRCLKSTEHSTSSSCIGCDDAVEVIAFALFYRDIKLSLSDEWSNKALDIIAKGTHCIICKDRPIPNGIRVPNAPPCERCEISREVRAKLIDFWNHMHEQLGVKTVFLSHKKFECVCEEEAVLKPLDEFSEDSSEEEDSEVDSEEEEEEQDG